MLHKLHPSTRPLIVLTLGFLTATASAKPPAEVPRGATPREIELGKKAAAELEKDPKIKLLDLKTPANKALADKLNGLVVELGKSSLRPDIKYSVKIIDDDDLNAFTLPNGQIYVYRGLIDFTGSDDELAGVLSHEIGHNARMHALRGQAKSRKLSLVGLAAMAAMLAGKSGADVGQFSQYLLMGIMNGYTEEYEKEADTAAIEQMKGTHYNPSALVTFMQRLEQEEKRRPEWEPGIFRTHPPTETRAAAAIAQIKAEGLPFTPRAVSGAKQAVVAEAPDRISVKFGGEILMELAATPDTLAATKVRAEAITAKLNGLLRSDLKLYEISVVGNDDGARLLARGEEVTRISPADARLQQLTPMQCAQKWRGNLGKIFWRETILGKM